MPTPTYVPLANVTLGATTGSVTFSSISQSYKDLVIVITARQTASYTGNQLKFIYNGDTGTNYSEVTIQGNGSTASSGSDANINFGFLGGTPSANAAAGLFGNMVISIFDYSVTNKHKTSLSRSNNANAEVLSVAMRWASTSALNTITIYPDTNTGSSFVAGSSFTLYGIAA